MLKKVMRMLSDRRIAALSVESTEILEVQRCILDSKPLLKRVFQEFYHLCRRLDDQYFDCDGIRVEIGAGTSLMRELYPDVIMTDIRPAAHLDRTLDAQAMELPDSSVRSIYGINCFHHFPKPRRFLDELTRVLAPGGGCILIEPYYGPFGKLLYKRLFASEGFDKTQLSWETTGLGAMQGANQALSYIIFKRDLDKFRVEFPGLELVHAVRLNNYLRYIASGGLNFKQMVPNCSEGCIRLVEGALSWASPFFSLHHALVLRRKKSECVRGHE